MNTVEQKPSTRDALEYLKKVRTAFQYEKEKYNIFVELLRDFNAQRIDVPSVRDRVKILFKGHNDLLEGFNFFLPEVYQITLALEDEQPSEIQRGPINSRGGKKVSLYDAIAYVGNVKHTFQEDREKFQHFLEIMKNFKRQTIDREDVVEKLKELFKGHDDLLVGLNAFLPQKYEITFPMEDEQGPKEDDPAELAEEINAMGKMRGEADLLHEFTKLFIGSAEKDSMLP